MINSSVLIKIPKEILITNERGLASEASMGTCPYDGIGIYYTYTMLAPTGLCKKSFVKLFIRSHEIFMRVTLAGIAIRNSWTNRGHRGPFTKFS